MLIPNFDVIIRKIPTISQAQDLVERGVRSGTPMIRTITDEAGLDSYGAATPISIEEKIG